MLMKGIRCLSETQSPMEYLHIMKDGGEVPNSFFFFNSNWINEGNFRFLLLRLYSLWKITNIFSQCSLNHGNAIPSDACIINSLIHTFLSHTHTNLYILVLQNNKTKFMFKKENNNFFLKRK